jgi:hypothetical protein
LEILEVEIPEVEIPEDKKVPEPRYATEGKIKKVLFITTGLIYIFPLCLSIY